MMLQKWFRVQSDPELKNQINDRLSFKKFLDLPFSEPISKPSPDHSTFSRFRKRLSKNAIDQIDPEIGDDLKMKQVIPNANSIKINPVTNLSD